MKLSEYNYVLDGFNHQMHFRVEPSSDLAVINQIMQHGVYSLDGWVHKQILENYLIDNYKTQRPLIVDAGANIGASSIYFSNSWSNSMVISIEPEKYNFALLKLNTVGKNIIALEGAIGSKQGALYLSDPGHGDVGFRVSHKGDYEVNVYTPNQLIELGNINGAKPFICKIDIEGGEVELFSDNTEWMDLFPLIIIELHDWMLPMEGSSKPLLNALSILDFDILHKGENIFLFNRKLLASVTVSK